MTQVKGVVSLGGVAEGELKVVPSDSAVNATQIDNSFTNKIIISQREVFKGVLPKRALCALPVGS